MRKLAADIYNFAHLALKLQTAGIRLAYITYIIPSVYNMPVLPGVHPVISQ